MGLIDGDFRATLEETGIARAVAKIASMEGNRAARETVDAASAILKEWRETQAGLVAQTRTQHLNAVRDYETNKRLFDVNPQLVAKNELDRTKDLAEELSERVALEEERPEVLALLEP